MFVCCVDVCVCVFCQRVFVCVSSVCVFAVLLLCVWCSVCVLVCVCWCVRLGLCVRLCLTFFLVCVCVCRCVCVCLGVCMRVCIAYEGFCIVVSGARVRDRVCVRGYVFLRVCCYVRARGLICVCVCGGFCVDTSFR